MKIKAVHSFKMLGIKNCATQRNYTEDMNPQPQSCRNLRSCILSLLTKVKLLCAWLYQSKAHALCFSSN
jgi:hypothetical protein